MLCIKHFIFNLGAQGSNKIFINKHIQMSNDNPCDGDADCKYPKNHNKA